MTQIVPQKPNRFWLVTLVPFLVGMSGQAGWAQDLALKTPQTFETPVPYEITFRSPHALRFNRTGEIILRVQNGQGELVDDVPVTFEVDSDWEDYVTIAPMQTRTQDGIARVRIRAEQLGLSGVTARAGSTTEAEEIVVLSYHPNDE